jgi:hypothetical protein
MLLGISKGPGQFRRPAELETRYERPERKVALNCSCGRKLDHFELFDNERAPGEPGCARRATVDRVGEYPCRHETGKAYQQPSKPYAGPLTWPRYITVTPGGRWLRNLLGTGLIWQDERAPFWPATGVSSSDKRVAIYECRCAARWESNIGRLVRAIEATARAGKSWLVAGEGPFWDHCQAEQTPGKARKRYRKPTASPDRG